MKKMISFGIFALAVITLHSCSMGSGFLKSQPDSEPIQKQDFFTKKSECFKRNEEYKQLHDKKLKARNETITWVFYSPVLDTCMATITANFVGTTDYSFIDILTDKEEGGFSADIPNWLVSGYLPKACEWHSASNWENTINEILYIPGTPEEKLINKTYSLYFKYLNCFAYLTDSPSINVIINAPEITNFKPKFTDPGASYEFYYH